MILFNIWSLEGWIRSVKAIYSCIDFIKYYLIFDDILKALFIIKVYNNLFIDDFKQM